MELAPKIKQALGSQTPLVRLPKFGCPQRVNPTAAKGDAMSARTDHAALW